VVIRWFCELCYGVVGSEGDSNVSVFKQVGDSAYVWGGKGEGIGQTPGMCSHVAYLLDNHP